MPRNSQKHYILGAVATLVVSLFVPILSTISLVAFTAPVFILGNAIGKQWVHIEMFGAVPQGWGWLVAAVLWIHIGVLIGKFIYHIRYVSSQKRGKEIPSFGPSAVITVLAMEAIIGLLFLLPALYIIQKQHDKKKDDQKAFFAEHCTKKIERPNFNYYLYKCDDGDVIIPDVSGFDTKYLQDEQKNGNFIDVLRQAPYSSF